VIADWRTAQVSPQLSAVFVLIDKLVRTPDDVNAADIAAVRAAGVSKAAIRDAVYVCAMFSTIVRLADAFQWDIPATHAASVDALTKYGYKLPPLL
jgi:alkylhydroperoxidase family enzyme